MARWIVLEEARVGFVEAPDRDTALRIAQRQYGHGVLRVQSVVSAALGAEDERAARRDRRPNPSEGD